MPELGLLFFVAHDGTTGQELWRTDGTAAGTFRLGDFSGPGDAPQFLTSFDGKLFFSNRDTEHGIELWESDGTAEGTKLAVDLRMDAPDGQPTELSVIGPDLYFAARFDPAEGSGGLMGQLEPHVFDGEIVTPLGDFNGMFGSGPRAFWHVDNAAGARTVFYANDDDDLGASGIALMRTDGTAGGTERIRFFEPYAFAGAPPISNGAYWFFGAITPDEGGELWRSDGTDEGTALVLDIRPGSANSGLSAMRRHGDRVCFVADDGTHGRELWCSGGDAANTAMVADINPDGTSSDPVDVVRIGDVLWFQATQGTEKELWFSEGFSGAQKVDVLPGSFSSTPKGLANIGGVLYFSATSATAGAELFRMCPDCAIDGACVAAGAVNPANPCETCNPDLDATAWSEVPELTPCDDGDPCTQSDTCTSGLCTSLPIDCDDDDPCTDDACDDGGCVSLPAAVSIACDDGDACTTGDACDQGSCGGLATVCDDGDPCTIDACDASDGSCDSSPATDGGACDDANLCTQSSTCQGGACVGADPVVCPGGGACGAGACDPATGTCSTEPLTDGTACDDGDLCTTGATCADGACVGGTPKLCDDSNPCTSDSCNAATGACVFTPADGTPCDDGNICTGPDQCLASACAPGAPVAGCCGSATDCDDGQQCTQDDCVGNVCQFSAINANGNACDDSDACTEDDTCFDGGCEGAPKDCDDLESCTTDACANGACTHTAVADGVPCDDGDLCTKNDSCSGGACAGANPVKCEPAGGCALNLCQPLTGLCEESPIGAGLPCDDGDVCTILDSCDGAGLCSGVSVDPCCESDDDCDDGNVCTVDTCTQATNKCAYDPAGAVACDDGDPCTTADVCVDATCTGDAVSCEPSDDVCFENLCLFGSEGCELYPVADGLACDDGDVCTEDDACAGDFGCIGTPVPECDPPKPLLSYVEPSSPIAGVPHTYKLIASAPTLDPGGPGAGQTVVVLTQLLGGDAAFTPVAEVIVDGASVETADYCTVETAICNIGPRVLLDNGAFSVEISVVACQDYTVVAALESDDGPGVPAATYDVDVRSFCPPGFKLETFELPREPQDSPTTVRTGLKLEATTKTPIGPTTVKIAIPDGVRVLDAAFGPTECIIEDALVVCELLGDFVDGVTEGTMTVVGQVLGAAQSGVTVASEVADAVLDVVDGTIDFLFGFTPPTGFTPKSTAPTDPDAATTVTPTAPSAKNLPVNQFKVSGSATEELDLSKVTVGVFGNPALIDKLRLVYDANGDGVAAPDEPTLSEAKPTGPKATLPIPMFNLPIGVTQNMAVYADLAGAQLVTVVPTTGPRWPPALPWLVGLLALALLAGLATRTRAVWRPLLAVAIVATGLSCGGGDDGGISGGAADEVQIRLESISAAGAVSGDPAELVATPLDGPTFVVK
ncbi:MAG: hypothetical protein R3F39_02085 [Myxococcota bacterium]